MCVEICNQLFICSLILSNVNVVRLYHCDHKMYIVDNGWRYEVSYSQYNIGMLSRKSVYRISNILYRRQEDTHPNKLQKRGQILTTIPQKESTLYIPVLANVACVLHQNRV